MVVAFPSECLKMWAEDRYGGFRQAQITRYVNPLNKRPVEANTKTNIEERDYEVEEHR